MDKKSVAPAFKEITGEQGDGQVDKKWDAVLWHFNKNLFLPLRLLQVCPFSLL